MSERGQKRGIRALAASTGFSVATISRVLNRPELVSAKTREHILRAIDETGYQRHPAARALATRRSRTIGAVVPTLSHSIFAHFLDAVESTLATSGYGLVIATTGFDQAVETQRARALIDLGAEALVLSGDNHEPELLALLDMHGVPTVCSSVHRTRCGLPAIGYDNRAIGAQALGHLHTLGHARMAVLHGPLTGNDRAEARLQGARAFAESRNLEPIAIETAFSAEGGASGLRDLMARAAGVTAVLCLSDVLALGVLFEARRQKLDIPGDLSLMGVDDLDWSAVSEPGLTTVRLPARHMGVIVAESLITGLEEGHPPQSSTLDAQLVARASTGVCRARPTVL